MIKMKNNRSMATTVGVRIVVELWPMPGLMTMGLLASSGRCEPLADNIWQSLKKSPKIIGTVLVCHGSMSSAAEPMPMLKIAADQGA